MTRDVPIRPAATLLLIRDVRREDSPQTKVGEDGIEVLAMRRADTMRFLPGHLAFPGGTLDKEDWDLYEKFRGTVSVQNQGSEDDVAYAVGALRECAEEIGIACAVRKDGNLTDFPVPAEEHEELVSSTRTFHSWLALQEFEMDFEQLRFIGRWVTPSVMPARFDTRFFLYRLRETDIEMRVSLAENDWAKWVSPKSALSQIEKGAIQAVPPTIAMLRALTRYASVDDCFGTLSVPGPDGDFVPTHLSLRNGGNERHSAE